MKRYIVVYGLGGATSPKAQREGKTAQKWATSNDGQILLTRRDGESLGGVDRRERLHQALFCLRANLANVLWMPNWQVLGDVATQELVCAHVWAVGGEVVVDDEVIDHIGVVSEEQQRLREMAQTSVPVGNKSRWNGRGRRPGCCSACTRCIEPLNWASMRLRFSNACGDLSRHIRGLEA